MSYVLDGIETAMEARSYVRDWLPYGTIGYVRCPCKWRTPTWRARRMARSDLHALRFHYAWCEQAKVKP